MIEWNLFYKMLGIPEEVTEPTLYDLLGLNPETCSAELVDHMLHIQKNRLRQNIPGPQFIPLILSFERRKLERAAAVLREPRTRQKYREYLQRQASQRRRESQKERARQRLLWKARDIVNSLLNPDKTLDDSERPILAARLRELGVGDHRIDSFLRRIPRPTGEPARPDDQAMEYFITAVDLAIGGSLLTPDAERTIMELARKLNINDAQAVKTIDQELARKNARRGRRDTSVLEHDFENRVRSMIPNGLATADQHELLLALGKADNLPEESARDVLRRCLRISASSGPVHKEQASHSVSSISREEPKGVAVKEQSGETQQSAAITPRIRPRRHALLTALLIIVLGCFVLSVCFLGVSGIRYARQLVSPATQTSAADPNIIDPKEQETSVVSAESRETSRQEQRPGDSTVAPQSAQENTGRTEEQQEHRITSSRRGDTPGSGQVLITAEDVRRVYSGGARTEDLLADLAMTMFACYGRAKHFALGSTDYYDELHTQMHEPDRPSYLTRVVTIVNVLPAAGAAQSAPPAPAQAESETRKGGSRIRSAPDSIEQLRIEDTPEAAGRLLSSLRKRGLRSPGRIEMVSRTLRALSTMTDPGIPRRLIDLLAKSSPEVAFQIARTLARASGTNASYERLTSGLLPPANTPVQRQACAQWWRNNPPTWGQARSIRPMPSRGVSPPTGQTTRGQSQTAWKPDPVTIKLLAVTAHYAELAGAVLKEHKWDAATPVPTQEPGTNMLGVTCSASQVGTDLLDSLDGISNELSRIITDHPDYEKATPMIDAITLHEKHPRTAACQSQLQKVVVNLDATAELLIALLQQTDPNDELKEALHRIQVQRQKALTGAINVVHELRESCYYNLVLWDKLIEHNIDAAIAVPGNVPARRARR